MIKTFFTLGLVLCSSLAYSFESINLDASGADGFDGSPGSSHSTSPGASYGRGSDGGNAGRSTPGKDGADINVDLKQITTTTGSASLVVTGRVRGSGVNTTLTLNSSTIVATDAHGGRGGDGGHGGDGQGGCNGHDGHNATRYSSGTNGTSGCRGGDGGDGTPGSNGGDGGKIKAKVPLDETHLFLAFTCDVNSGQGGAPGSNGRGGSGGYGGRGGKFLFMV